MVLFSEELDMWLHIFKDLMMVLLRLIPKCLQALFFWILPRKYRDIRGETVMVSSSHRHLGGVVVSVLATGPKGCGFKTRSRRWIFKGDKIRSTPSSRMGSKAGRSHVVRFYGL
jgi:hypothetical protein